MVHCDVAVSVPPLMSSDRSHYKTEDVNAYRPGKEHLQHSVVDSSAQYYIYCL